MVNIFNYCVSVFFDGCLKVETSSDADYMLKNIFFVFLTFLMLRFAALIRYINWRTIIPFT